MNDPHGRARQYCEPRCRRRACAWKRKTGLTDDDLRQFLRDRRCNYCNGPIAFGKKLEARICSRTCRGRENNRLKRIADEEKRRFKRDAVDTA